MSRSCGLRHAYPGRTVEKVAGRIAAVSALRGGHKDSATGGDPTHAAGTVIDHPLASTPATLPRRTLTVRHAGTDIHLRGRIDGCWS
jgi:hypothetical protein